MMSAASTWESISSQPSKSTRPKWLPPLMPVHDWFVAAMLVLAAVFAVTLATARSDELSSSLVATAAGCLASIPWLWAVWLERRADAARRWRIVAAAVGLLAAADIATTIYILGGRYHASAPQWVDAVRMCGAVALATFGLLVAGHDTAGQFIRERGSRPILLAGAGALALVVAVPLATSQELSSSPFDWLLAFALVSIPLTAALFAVIAFADGSSRAVLSSGRLTLGFGCVLVSTTGHAIDRLTSESVISPRTSWFMLPSMALLATTGFRVLSGRSNGSRQLDETTVEGDTWSNVGPRSLIRAIIPYLIVGVAVAISLTVLDDTSMFVRAILVASAAITVMVVAARQAVAHAAQSRAERRLEQASIELARRANVDPVTQLPNRRALDGRLAEEVERAVRYRQPLSLCFIDLDHFKDVNDRYGHATGDAALRQVAATLRRTARAIDFVGRFGGEEFVVLVPGTWSVDAATLGERLRRAVARTAIQSPDGRGFTVSISVGIAGLPEHARDAETLNDCADKALYAAKQAGRNHVVLFDPGVQLHFPADDMSRTSSRPST